MKKILFLLLISGSVSAQPRIDTVIVRNLTMQAQDYAWLIGSNGNPFADSVSGVFYRRVMAQIRANPPAQWTTNVTLDSIPGRIAVQWYEYAKSAAAGEIVSRYTAITNALSAKTNIAYWVGFIDANHNNEFTRRRNQGKIILLDN